MAVMMCYMGIEFGLDVDKVLDVGRMMKKIAGRSLRSESVSNGCVLKEPQPQFAR